MPLFFYFGQVWVYIVNLANGDSLALSESHPIYTRANGWCAINPGTAPNEHAALKLTTLQVGDEVLILNNGNFLVSQKIISIHSNGDLQYMYNLVKVEGDNTFFANGVLVHNKFISE